MSLDWHFNEDLTEVNSSVCQKTGLWFKLVRSGHKDRLIVVTGGVVCTSKEGEINIIYPSIQEKNEYPMLDMASDQLEEISNTIRQKAKRHLAAKVSDILSKI